MKKHWPILTLIFVEFAIVATNITPGTYLAGWDNLLPEFNFPLNFLRSIFGVWLEYRGLGLYDGMSHIANLFHTITIWIMSLVIPQQLLRYSFTLGMHVLGGIGAYVLITTLFTHRSSLEKKILGFVGGLFYMLNLTTIQMFFAPLEAYAVYFVCLPWLSWGIINFYTNYSKKSYVLFLSIALLTTPMFWVTTLLLPIGILLTTLTLPYLVKDWNTYISRIAYAGIGFLLINAFWLLPYLWGLPHNAPIIAQAKINQMGSGEIFLRNQAFGNIQDVLKLRGFSLDYEDLSKDAASLFMMEPWRTFIHTPFAEVIAGIIAVVTLIGLLNTVLSPKQRSIGFTCIWILGFIFLGTDIPGLRELTAWLRQTVPFFDEAFRFTFTKFGLFFTLAYTIMFIQGICVLLGTKPSKIWIYTTLTLATSVLIFLSLPAFQGNFLYQNLRVQLPSEYQQFFAYTKTLNPNARMALLPQPSYWSWKYFRFGYRGSGFLWMGVPQPTMDRAFDPWSATNENYYWELSYALYSKNSALLQSVLAKYDISYLVLDENVLSFSNNRSLFIDETKELLGPPAKTFGKLSLWEKTPTTNNFISLKQNLPTVNPYSWTDNDIAYSQLGDYITGDGGITYPYRSLFTKRSVTERDFDVNTILPLSTIAYDSTASADLSATAVKECGLLKDGTATATMTGGALQFTSKNQRGCLSFDIPTLSHKFGYLTAVENTHISGRPLMISFINDTAKHVELETYLDGKTDYFILPPLAPDGLGYTVYISNDSIGKEETINSISHIRIYQIPYNELVNLHTGNWIPASAGMTPEVSHPNPAWYTVKTNESGTLMLSQSYDAGWIAIQNNKLLPHMMVNNWENGWTLTSDNLQSTIYILFWPQLLEFLGFLLLPIPFIIKIKRTK